MQARPTTPTVLPADAVSAITSAPLGTGDGVNHRVLWRDGTSVAGLLTIDAGRRLGVHQHRVNHHHIWVVAGHASVFGRLVDPGSYVHVPCGVDHDIDATSTEGCTVFYVYEPPER